jgi:hypothetical protein
MFVPHAAFKTGKMFAGSFKEVMDSPLLADCFLDCFVPSAREMSDDALFVGLGPCPQAAYERAQDLLKAGRPASGQVLGAFCHPSTSGGLQGFGKAGELIAFHDYLPVSIDSSKRE